MEDILGQVGNETLCPMCIIVKDDCVLLGHRHYVMDNNTTLSVWTTPGGRCDPNETVEQTLRRELQEEVNITEFNLIDYIDEGPGSKEGDRVPVFYATTVQDFTLMEPEKFSEWKWIPISDYLAGAPWSDMNPHMHAMISTYLTGK